MQDIIFWGTNYDVFVREAVKISNKLFIKDHKTREYKNLFSSTPVITNKNGEFMVLIRANTGVIGELDKCTTIQNLGTYVVVLNSPAKREIYDRIYSNAPYESTDSEGNTIIVTPPEKFGIFA